MKRAGYSRPLGHYVGKWWVSGQIGGRFRLCLHIEVWPNPFLSIKLGWIEFLAGYEG